MIKLLGKLTNYYFGSNAFTGNYPEYGNFSLYINEKNEFKYD